MLSSWFGLEPIPICSIDPAPFSGWGQESRSIPRWRNSGCPVGGRGGASTSSCHPDPPPDHLRDLRNPRTGPVGREKRDKWRESEPPASANAGVSTGCAVA